MAADRGLVEYRRKRDFAATSEPQGGEAAGSGCRFVVQEHHARRLHWDLRLEHDGVLASWAVPNGIPDDPASNRKAVRTEDHPLEYLDFHGEIPAGSYGAGRMEIWDEGTYECHSWEDRKVVVTFHGRRLKGRHALFQAGSGKDWMIHRMDPADPEREPMPEHVVPMLATLSNLPADGEGWAYEVKWDGVRAVAYCEPGRLRLESRNLNDITARYPELRGLVNALGARTAVLDGEVCALDEQGRPSFERLQRRMHLTNAAQVRRLASEAPVLYVIFDILYLDGRSLIGCSYDERRAELEALRLEGPAWRMPAAHLGSGQQFLAASRAQGLEGIMAKRRSSRYEPGKRTGAWLKVKNTARQELLIAGWLPGEGRRRERIGALLAGYYDDAGELRYAGKVGTGFGDRDLDELARMLAPLAREESPFTGRQPAKGARFAEPRLVAEIEFTEWTSQGMLRHPSYKGLRSDKQARKVTREQPAAAAAAPQADAAALIRDAAEAAGGRRGATRTEVEVDGRRIRLSNLGKVLYPESGFTKGQALEYYAAVAPVLLPHLEARPITMKRYPEGIAGKHFYEKSCPSHRPDWVETASVPSTRKGTISFCLVNGLASLLWSVNLANLEMHPLLSRVPELDRPQMLMFDLDPGAPAGILECARVALLLRGMFDQLACESFVKVSGSKGIQLAVPTGGTATFEQTKPFAKAVAETLERAEPELVVSLQAKELRRGKVLVDWSQNDNHKSTVAVHSLRAKRDPPLVSAPVTWEELESALAAGDPASLEFGPQAALERIERLGDLWAPALTLRQELPLGAGPS